MSKNKKDRELKQLAQYLHQGQDDAGEAFGTGPLTEGEAEAVQGDLRVIEEMLSDSGAMERQVARDQTTAPDDIQAAVRRGLMEGRAELESQSSSPKPARARWPQGTRSPWLLAIASAAVLLVLFRPILMRSSGSEDPDGTGGGDRELLGGGNGIESLEVLWAADGTPLGILFGVSVTIPDFEATIRVYSGEMQNDELLPSALLHTTDELYETAWDLPEFLRTDKNGLTLVLDLRDALTGAQKGESTVVFIPPHGD